MNDSDIYAACTRMRLQIADELDALTESQLRSPSLCDRWTVLDVGAHLAAAVAQPAWKLLAALPRAGLRPLVANAVVARDVATHGRATVVAQLRANASRALKFPVVGTRGPLTDLLVHGCDYRLPLGIEHRDDPTALVEALDFLTNFPPGFVPKHRLAGLRLVAVDADRTWLDGLEVRGDLTDLMMAACGRPFVVDRLSGSGASVLAGRIKPRS